MGQSSISIPWLDTMIHSNWWPILLPIGYGIFRGIEYLWKRSVEGKPESEKIEQYHRLADLKEKLEKGGVTIADLNALRSQTIGDQADNAITMAEQYAFVAKRLVADAENANEAASDLARDRGAVSSTVPALGEALTQADMNSLSGQKAAQADDELSAVVQEMLSLAGEAQALLLRRAEAAWEVFREAEVAREANLWEGGSIRPLMANLKYEAITRERIAMLATEGRIEGATIVAELTKTPRNLFEHVEPHVPKDNVHELLGTPSLIAGDRWYYRYEDTQVEISFDDNEAVNDVVVALCDGHVYEGLNGVCDVPLGRMSIADLLEVDPQLRVEHRFSARTEELTIWVRIGPGGAWTDYCFGSLKVLSGAGRLFEVDFEWDYENERLVSDPKAVLINWMALPSTTEPPFFSWFIK